MLSLPVKGAWIEIMYRHAVVTWTQSLPVKGAWIEIIYKFIIYEEYPVAPCEGSVD